MMEGLMLHQFLCFEPVIIEVGFQAAVEKLLRPQPTVSSSVKTLETQLAPVTVAPHRGAD
jgi:DNA-binding transcriptional LysR family regulator